MMISGEGKNFFLREKKFFPSPEPLSFFKKSEIFLLPMVAKKQASFAVCGKITCETMPKSATNFLP